MLGGGEGFPPLAWVELALNSASWAFLLSWWCGADFLPDGLPWVRRKKVFMREGLRVFLRKT